MLTNHVAEFLFPNFVERIRQVENLIKTIEIINNTRGDIEGKIWERSDWGGGGGQIQVPDVHSFTMSQAKKSFWTSFSAF